MVGDSIGKNINYYYRDYRPVPSVAFFSIIKFLTGQGAFGLAGLRPWQPLPGLLVVARARLNIY